MKPISFKDELPKHGQKILVIAGDIVAAGKFDKTVYPDSQCWLDSCEFSGYEWDWDFDLRDATHWLPMPTAADLMKEVTR